MKLPLFQLVLVASCPVKKILAPSSLLPHQVCIHVDKIPLSLLCSTLLIWQILQSLYHLWSFAGLTPVCPCLSYTGEPSLGPSTPSVSHQGFAEWKDHLSWPSSNANPNATQDGSMFQGHIAGLSSVPFSLPFLFCRAAFKPVSPQCVLVPGVIPPQVWHCISRCQILWGSCWALSLAWWSPSEWHNSLAYQPLLPVLHHQQTRWVCILSHHLSHWGRWLKKIILGISPRGRPLGTWPPAGLCADRNPLRLAVQLVFSAPCCPLS